MRFIKHAATCLALMATIGSASAIPVTDIIDPSQNIAISVGNPYTFTHDITDGVDGYVTGFDSLVSAMLTISLIDNVSKGNEVFRFAFGSGAALQFFDGQNVNNGNSGTDFPIMQLAALADLSADGILSVTLSASEGNYLFTQSVLSAEIVRGGSGSAQAAATAVPEPGTLALLGLGFVGMGLMRKRLS